MAGVKKIKPATPGVKLPHPHPFLLCPFLFVEVDHGRFPANGTESLATSWLI